jgi:hypothetical protein
MRPLKVGNDRRLIGVLLATGVIARTHVAISCHLLAAFHFDLRHGRCGKTCEGRRGRPHQNQNKRQDGTALQQGMMLHVALVDGKAAVIYLDLNSP